jgi:hypothetical protein
VKRCPKCKVGVVSLQPVLKSKSLGTYSIAGAQTKIVAKNMMLVTCSSCDLNVTGRLEGATMDNKGTFTGGHFVEER